MLLAHGIFASVFTGFIVVDRLVLRYFVPKKNNEKIYKLALIPLAIIATTIVLSGIFLCVGVDLDLSLWAKIICAIMCFVMFFACPFAMKRLSCNACKSLYRFGVVFFLSMVFVFLHLDLLFFR